MNHSGLSNENFIEHLKFLIGTKNVLTDPGDTAAYLRDWTGTTSGRALAIARPASTSEVSKVVEYCRENQVSIVPQGGRTGLCGGGVPAVGTTSLVLSLDRMASIRNIDTEGRTVVAEAGVILETLQNEVAKENLLFPLMFGAKGSCTLGGNLATNAGGSNVVRYGNTRELCVGIEAVMANGEVVNGLNDLRKDNTGYDIRNLLIGSEGTLGVITAAVFKLFPQPLIQKTAFLSLCSIDAALHVLNTIQDRFGGAVEAFEYVPQPVINAICKAFPNIRAPFSSDVRTGILLEVSSTRVSDAEPDAESASRLEAELFAVLEQLMEEELILDAVVAQSEQQRLDFWRLRESVLESIIAHGPSYHFDISLPLSNISAFLQEADLLVHELGFKTLTIGHLGDGNLHYALASDNQETWDTLPLEETKKKIFKMLTRLNGSFSAEHGIGVTKLDTMLSLKDPAQLNMMRSIKTALDPEDTFNPGKLVPAPP